MLGLYIMTIGQQSNAINELRATVPDWAQPAPAEQPQPARRAGTVGLCKLLIPLVFPARDRAGTPEIAPQRGSQRRLHNLQVKRDPSGSRGIAPSRTGGRLQNAVGYLRVSAPSSAGQHPHARRLPKSHHYAANSNRLHPALQRRGLHLVLGGEVLECGALPRALLPLRDLARAAFVERAAAALALPRVEERLDPALPGAAPARHAMREAVRPAGAGDFPATRLARTPL